MTAELSRGDTAIYKGKKYRVGYIGTTKYSNGEIKVKLEFFSNSAKSFWVDADKVEAAGTGDFEDSHNGRSNRVFSGGCDPNYYRRNSRTFDSGKYVKECSCGNRSGVWNNGSRNDPDWVCNDCM